ALNRRQFREFLEEIEESYGELLLHTDVRWLSRGKVLVRFWALRPAVIQFLREKHELEPECTILEDPEFLASLAFLVDITEHLNTLNIQLQGSNKIFTNLVNAVDAFKLKLKLFTSQLKKGNSSNFVRLNEFCETHEVSADQYTTKFADSVQLLLDEFSTRFTDFGGETPYIPLFTNPFIFPDEDIEALKTELQMEIIELKSNSILKSRFQEISGVCSAEDVLRFWKLLPIETFPNL